MSDLDKELIDRYFDSEDIEQLRKQLGIKAWLRGYASDDPQLDYAVFQPTCNIQGFTSGYQGEGIKTIVPAKASAKLDFRLVPNQDPKDIFEKLKNHLIEQGFEDIKVEWKGAMWPYKAAPDNPFVELVRDMGQEVYNAETQMFPITGGSSPMYSIGGPLNVPIVWAGLGYPHSSTHAPDEHFRLKDFTKTAQYLARIVDRFSDLA